MEREIQNKSQSEREREGGKAKRDAIEKEPSEAILSLDS